MRDNFPNGECGQISNLAFGTPQIRTRHDPDLLRGWGKRNENWQGTVTLDHELRPGVGLRFGYFRTSFGNFTATENVAVGPADFDPSAFALTAARRWGEEVCGFFDIKPEAFGLSDRLVSLASN